MLATTTSVTTYVGAAMAVATPFLTAFGFIGKWLLNRLDKAETEKTELYGKLINDVVPALKSSTDQVRLMIDQQQNLARTREAMLGRMEDLAAEQDVIVAKLEDLRKQELALAKRRGGSQ